MGDGSTQSVHEMMMCARGMKKLILFAIGSLLLAHAGLAQNLDELGTTEGAKAYIQLFYKEVGQTSILVVNSSPFVAKELNGNSYMVAKMWITDSSTGQQFVRGIVIDMETSWRQAMTESDYHQFLQTGNKLYLHEKLANLDPNS
jgi:hypothetical protein